MERKKYKKVHFRLDSGYKWGPGWTCDSAPFREEIRRLFKGAGWELTTHDDNSGTSDEVRKDGQYLYLHPMDITGYVSEENVDAISAMLDGAKSFRRYATDTYEYVYEVEDESDELEFYREYWKDRIEEVLQRCTTTKRRNLWKRISAVKYYLWESVIHIKTTLCPIGVYSSGDTCEKYIKEVIDEYIAKGLIICADGGLVRWRSKYDK